MVTLYLSNHQEKPRSLFKAIQEDIDSKDSILGAGAYKNSPAYRYTSIIDNKDNYLYNTVLELRGILQKYIAEFNTLAQNKISITALDNKLFQGNIEQIGNFFVYEVY